MTNPLIGKIIPVSRTAFKNGFVAGRIIAIDDNNVLLDQITEFYFTHTKEYEERGLSAKTTYKYYLQKSSKIHGEIFESWSELYAHIKKVWGIKG